MWNHLENILTLKFLKIYHFGVYWSINHYILPNHFNYQPQLSVKNKIVLNVFVGYEAFNVFS